MTPDFMSLGGVEIISTTRLAAYLASVGSPFTSVGSCSCPTLTAEVIDGTTGYTDPATDMAPWYDPDVPASAEFLGFLPLSIDGLDDSPLTRTVTNAITGGGALGPARVQPRTLTFTVLVVGTTCCGVDYGLQFLLEALQGCTGNQCDGDCLSMYSCCPGDDTLDPDTYNQLYRRSFYRVALTDGPRVIDRNGDGCSTGKCQSGADILTVEFVLTAATPWAWTDLTPLLDVNLPTDTGDDYIPWCIHTGDPDEEGDTCQLAPCTDPVDACADPFCQPPTPPTVLAPSTCFCLPVAVREDCYDIDLTGRPAWSVDAPVITLRAGSEDLRNVTVTLYERGGNQAALTCDEIADQARCEPHSTYTLSYAPAGSSVTFDAQTGRAVVECGGSCEGSAYAFGKDGAPPTWATLTCSMYCICVATDALVPPAEDARILFSVAGRGL